MRTIIHEHDPTITSDMSATNTKKTPAADSVALSGGPITATFSFVVLRGEEEQLKDVLETVSVLKGTHDIVQGQKGGLAVRRIEAWLGERGYVLPADHSNPEDWKLITVWVDISHGRALKSVVEHTLALVLRPEKKVVLED